MTVEKGLVERMRVGRGGREPAGGWGRNPESSEFIFKEFGTEGHLLSIKLTRLLLPALYIRS